MFSWNCNSVNNLKKYADAFEIYYAQTIEVDASLIVADFNLEKLNILEIFYSAKSPVIN